MAPPANKRDWDYTDAEWELISAAIKRVRSDPLSDTERDALRITAKSYILPPTSTLFAQGCSSAPTA